jgi:hypothetical protein
MRLLREALRLLRTDEMEVQNWKGLLLQLDMHSGIQKEKKT